MLKKNAEPEVNWDLMEKSVVETALPAHMMFLAAQALITEGYVLRADVQKYLNSAAAAAFAPLSSKPFRVQRTAKRVDALAQSALNKLNPDQTIHALYVSAMLVAVLVDEGLYADTSNVCVSTALVLLEDLRQEDGVENYAFREGVLKIEAHNLLAYLKKQELYGVQSIATLGEVTPAKG